MWPETYDINVSRESLDRLETYHALLLKWQKAINLVSPKTLDEAWVRHFADSAQLSQYIPEGTKFIMDWGSGAGFPGAVLSCMHDDVDFVLVESDERKCQFLRTVSRETFATMRVENERIEQVVANLEVIPDVITARALKSVRILLDFAAPLLEKKQDLRLLLLKGESVDAEIEEAREIFDFEVEKYPSITNPLASIIMLSNISVKN